MRININSISEEPLVLGENISPGALDLETGIVKFLTPIKVRAEVSRITNAVYVEMDLAGKMQVVCSRCLKEFEIGLDKHAQLNYPADKGEQVLELDPDIREEIILDYPLRPLCQPDCKGLCPKCGKNLNEGKCSC